MSLFWDGLRESFTVIMISILQCSLHIIKVTESFFRFQIHIKLLLLYNTCTITLSKFIEIWQKKEDYLDEHKTTLG